MQWRQLIGSVQARNWADKLRNTHEHTISASASIMNKIMRVEATPSMLKVEFHETRKSVMDVMKQFVGRD